MREVRIGQGVGKAHAPAVHSDLLRDQSGTVAVVFVPAVVDVAVALNSSAVWPPSAIDGYPTVTGGYDQVFFVS